MNYAILRGDLEKDRDDFIEFWKINFPRWPASKYDWFYTGNFYGPAAYWIARDKDDNNRFIGTTVLFPKKFKINGKDEMLAIAGDFGVEKKHRGQGSASQITDESFKFIDEAGLAFIYATPNVVSEKVATRQGFRVVGRSVRMVKILNSKDYIKRILKSGFLASIFSKPINWYLKTVSPEKKYLKDANYGCEILEDFDDRFDRLWEKAGINYPMVGERTKDYLHWRFTECPFKKFKVCALTNKDKSEVLGYIIYRNEDGNIQISDIFSVDMDSTLDHLIARFVYSLRQDSADILTLFYLGNKKIAEAFGRFGFSERSDKRGVIAYIRDDSPYLELALNPENWHFFEGDNDT